MFRAIEYRLESIPAMYMSLAYATIDGLGILILPYSHMAVSIQCYNI